jgi:hypothetical protein
MELLEPLGIAYIGLLAGDAFHMAGVDQIDLDARFGHYIIKGDPVIAVTFHGGGFNSGFLNQLEII